MKSQPKDLIGEVQAAIGCGVIDIYKKPNGWRVRAESELFIAPSLRSALRKFVKAAKGGGK